MLTIGDLLVTRPGRFGGFKGTPELCLSRHWSEPDDRFSVRCRLWTVVGTHDDWHQLAGIDVTGNPVTGWLLGSLSVNGLHPLLAEDEER